MSRDRNDNKQCERALQTLHIAEVFRSVFYAPLYAAAELGFFDSEGLIFSLSTASTPASLPSFVLEGKSDIGLGGPMAVMLSRETLSDSDLVAFYTVVKRDPFLIVGNPLGKNFQFSDLLGKSIAMVSESPTPWILFQQDLRLHNIDLSSLKIDLNHSMEENITRLKNGEIDAIQVCEPYASQIESEAAGEVWYAAATRGEIPFTALYTKKQFLEKVYDTSYRIVRAMHNAENWLSTHNSQEIAEVIASYFEKTSIDILSAGIKRYQSLGLWTGSPILIKDGFNKLQQACISGGLLKQAVSFEEICDVNVALRALENI